MILISVGRTLNLRSRLRMSASRMQRRPCFYKLPAQLCDLCMQVVGQASKRIQSKSTLTEDKIMHLQGPHSIQPDSIHVDHVLLSMPPQHAQECQDPEITDE